MKQCLGVRVGFGLLALFWFSASSEYLQHGQGDDKGVRMHQQDRQARRKDQNQNWNALRTLREWRRRNRKAQTLSLRGHN